MKNILLALFVLAPWLASAFPVSTNKFMGKASESTPPGFDAVLWNWSGYDDQELTFMFSDATFSNAGVRLSYPVRGANYLDMSSPWGHGSVSQTTVVTIVNEVFTNCYGRVPGTTNYYAGYTNGMFSNANYYTEGYDYSGIRITSVSTNQIIFSGTRLSQSNAQNTASVVPTCVVYLGTNYTMQVPDYGVYTNNYFGSTSIITNAYSYYKSFSGIIKDPLFLTNNQWNFYGFTQVLVYPTGAFPGEPGKGYAQASGSGTGDIKSVSQTMRELYSATYKITINYEYSKITPVIPSATNATLALETNWISIVGFGSTNVFTNTLSHWDNTTYYETKVVVITNTSMDKSLYINYEGTTNAKVKIYSINADQINYAFASNGVSEIITNTVSTSNSVGTLSPGYTRINAGFSSNSITYSKYTVTVPRTNIPPDGMYYMEVLAYDNQTNQTRSLLKGQVTVSHSLYSNTNLALWTSPQMGRYSYLNDIYGSGWIVGGTGATVTTSGTNIVVSLSAITGYVARAGDTMTGDLGFTNAGLASLDFAAFDTATTGAIGAARLQWNSARDTLRLGLNANVNLDLGQQLMLYAKNQDTNTIAKGEVVIVNGSQGDNPTIKRASNSSEITSARTIGIAAESITVNNNGLVVTRGTIYGLNTTNFLAGDVLYLGPNGTMQTNLPDAPLHGVQIGTVERSHQSVGQIYVSIHNYNELDELSDVHIPSPTNLDVLTWIAASNRWEARAPVVNEYSYDNLTGMTMVVGSSGYGQGTFSDVFGGIVAGLFNAPAIIDNEANGASQYGASDGDGTLGIRSGSYGSEQRGYFYTGTGTLTDIQIYGKGSQQIGYFDPILNELNIVGTGSIQRGYFMGDATMTANGAAQLGVLTASSTATNNADGAIQILGGRSNEVYATTTNAYGSILVGPGSVDKPYVVKAAGGFIGDGTSISNVNAKTLGGYAGGSYVTVAGWNSWSTNVAKQVSVPTNNSAPGAVGYYAANASNLFIYVENALGEGTNRWLRITGGSVTW